MMIDDKVPQPPIDNEAPHYLPPSYAAVPVVGSAPTVIPSTPVSEAEWRAKLQKLQKKIRRNNWTNRGDEAQIVASMRDLAATHPDPEVQTYWTRRADDFERAPDTDKKAILVDIAIAMGTILAAPLVIIAALMSGTATVLRASGDLLTGGRVNQMWSK
ncbi:hypothetical protein B0H11DRAFT_2030502 [Mycena galericulata]|nr:hypothetical protein B0H11DRAFT_2030502 [Mycena galericulata]